MPQKRYRFLEDVIAAVTADTDSCDSEDEPEICILPPEEGAASEIEDINDDTLAAEEPGDVAGELELFTRSRRSSRVCKQPNRLKAPQKKTGDQPQHTPEPPRKKPKAAPDSDKVKPKWKKTDKFAHQMPAGLPVPLANSHPELAVTNRTV